MSEEIKSEYKIFEDINLENNKITKVSEISSYDGSGNYNDKVKNSGLYIHTPGNPTSTTIPNKDKGLIVATGHAQTRLDTVDNISDIINSTVNSQLYINSKGKTNIVSPNIDIKSADSPNTEIHIKNIKDSTCDEGITITTDRTKIVSSTSKNKTTKYSNDSNIESTILDFSSSVSSHIDLDRADIYQANTEIFVAGTKYGYSSANITDAEEKEISESDKKNGNALYVDSEKVNIYVDTTIKNDITSITSTLKQLGNVEINSDTNDFNSYYTHIDGTDLNVDTSSVNIGTENKTINNDPRHLKTSTINIGTANTHIKQSENDTEYRNTLAIGSDYSDLTIKGRDFLIDSDTSKTSNTSVDTSVNSTAKSYLRSYYTNSNDTYVNDLLTIGPNTDVTSHLELDGYANITGNLDVDGNIDVKNTLYLHNSGSEDTTTSYVKSNTNNASLQINNDTEVIISNASNDGNDPNQISIKDTEIKTKKNLNLDSDLFIAGKIAFDSEDSPHNPDINLIEHLNDINTQSLKVSRISGNNTVLSISTASDDDSSASDTFSVDAKTLTLTSINGNDSVTTGTVNAGRLKQTGNTYINTENITGNELIVKGLKTSIESATVNIGSDDSSNTGTINIGTVKTGNTITIGTTGNTSNIIVKGKDLELTSTGQTTGKSVSYLRVSDINTDTLKVNDSITVGEESETNNSFKLYGNADISNNLDVHNTIYLHSDDAKELSSVSYIQSKNVSGIDKELVINNDTKVTISNGSTDIKAIHIEPNKIDTKKDLDLNASQTIYGTLTFDGSDKKIIDLNTIQTGSLSIQTEGTSTDTLNLKYDNSDKSITIKSKKLNVTSANTINGNSGITGDITQTGNNTITGNVSINDGTATNTTDIDGSSVNINPDTVEIGTEDRTKNISLGHSTSNISITGANRFRLESKSSIPESSSTESKITVDKVAISNASNSNKVNIYWDPTTSTLVFEKE